MLKISCAGCLGLPPAIPVQFTTKCVLQREIAKNLLKPLFWGFKVVQGHQYWYA